MALAKRREDARAQCDTRLRKPPLDVQITRYPREPRNLSSAPSLYRSSTRATSPKDKRAIPNTGRFMLCQGMRRFAIAWCAMGGVGDEGGWKGLCGTWSYLLTGKDVNSNGYSSAFSKLNSVIEEQGNMIETRNWILIAQIAIQVFPTTQALI